MVLIYKLCDKLKFRSVVGRLGSGWSLTLVVYGISHQGSVGWTFVCSSAAWCCWVLNCLYFLFGLIILSFSFNFFFVFFFFWNMFIVFLASNPQTKLLRLLIIKNYTIGIRRIWITLVWKSIRNLDESICPIHYIFIFFWFCNS